MNGNPGLTIGPWELELFLHPSELELTPIFIYTS